MLSVFSKILEYCMLDRLTSFLNKYDTITNSQHGFRKGKSTSTALINFYNELIKGIDQHKFAIGIFCDLQKAFDCVQHDNLLDKLNLYGIRGMWLSGFAHILVVELSL